MSKMIRALMAAFAACTMVGQAQSATIINGNFELTSSDSSSEFGTLYPSYTVTGWNTSGYNFLFRPQDVDTVGAPVHYDGASNLTLYGPGNGYDNGLGASPVGGNFIAADSNLHDFDTDSSLTLPIWQTITDLEVGHTYEISFWWAAAQQTTYQQETYEGWDVSLGNEMWNFKTLPITNPEAGFQPWRQASYIFTANSTSETLSFLATGGPEGQPPFSLLDGVTINEVPEPATWAMMLVGFGFVGAALRGRRSIFGGTGPSLALRTA